MVEPAMKVALVTSELGLLDNHFQTVLLRASSFALWVCSGMGQMPSKELLDPD